MKAVIAIVGRPNVGKSTLFNRLTRSNAALVADYPGLTRDRIYGVGKVGSKPYIVVDTGGLTGNAEGVEALMASQARQAMEEADVIILLADGRGGLTAGDEIIASQLRQLGKRVFLAANKAEGLNASIATAEFQALGLGQPHAISAAHGDGIAALMEEVCEALPPEESEEEAEEAGIKVAMVGRPNVGKSTLLNRLLGEERVVVSDVAGTTRDSVYVPFERDEKRYTLIDTAGIRRRGRVFETVEKFSVVKTLQAIESAHVVLLLLDAHEGVTAQDASLAGLILESGKGLVVLVNKWDGLQHDQRERIKADLDYKLGFLDFAETRHISALHGTGVGELFGIVQRVHSAATRHFPTPELNRALEAAVQQHQPPLVRGRRIKLRYAHQGGSNPPLIIIHGNQTEHVPDAYRRYLENTFRRELRLRGTPLRIEFRGGENPYAGRKNTLTPRQIRKKRRAIKRFKD